MKLTVTFQDLNAQRHRIGAAQSDWKIGSKTLDPREKVLERLLRGIEIDIGDIEVGPGGLLTYKGEQILLYIRDTQDTLWTLTNTPEKSRRFHVAECRTLERMRLEGRFERYVVTNRMDGKFLVDWLDLDTNERGETEAELKVCKNCLTTLNWRGYQNANDRLLQTTGRRQEKETIWDNFVISEFLMEYATFFQSRPSRRDTEATPNVYVHNWAEISERRRRETGWRCEECGVDLSGQPGLLHCHHRNGVVTDNASSNLQVLCAIDHAAQPAHQHMKVSETNRRVILKARAEQGIKS